MDKLTKRDARKVLAIVDAGLVSGLGSPEPGKMCVEAAICFALGYDHGDRPKCVAPCIREYKIRINDSSWSSNEARTKGMRCAAIAQLGSTEIDTKVWRAYVVEQTIKRIVPHALRSAAAVHKDKMHAGKMIEAALRCEQEGTKDAAAAAYAADAAADAAANAAADAAAYAAAAAAANAATAAAANAATAAYAAAYAAANAEKRDEVLSIAAEICVEACIKCKTQGSKWLDIAA